MEPERRSQEGGVVGGAKPLGGRYTLKDLPTLAIQGAGGRGRTEQRPQWSPRGEAERAELWVGRSRLVGVLGRGNPNR